LRVEKVKAKKAVTLILGPRMKWEDPIEVGKPMRFRVDSKHRLYMIFKGDVVQIKKLDGDNIEVILENVVSSNYDIFNKQENRSYEEEDILFSSEEFK